MYYSVLLLYWGYHHNLLVVLATNKGITTSYLEVIRLQHMGGTSITYWGITITYGGITTTYLEVIRPQHIGGTSITYGGITIVIRTTIKNRKQLLPTYKLHCYYFYMYIIFL